MGCTNPVIDLWDASLPGGTLRSLMSVTVHDLLFDKEPQSVLSCQQEFRGEALFLILDTNMCMGR